jgi:purine-nucleoside phosphorylase
MTGKHAGRVWLLPKEGGAEMDRGTMHPKETLIMRMGMGTASCGSQSYELSTGIAGNPIIKSETTGKYFSLSWADLIEVARVAGIDKEAR